MKAEPKRTKDARGRFFVRIGGVGHATRRCQHTAPLFPLWLILDADGTLTGELKPLVDGTHA